MHSGFHIFCLKVAASLVIAGAHTFAYSAPGDAPQGLGGAGNIPGYVMEWGASTSGNPDWRSDGGANGFFNSDTGKLSIGASWAPVRASSSAPVMTVAVTFAARNTVNGLYYTPATPLGPWELFDPANVKPVRAYTITAVAGTPSASPVPRMYFNASAMAGHEWSDIVVVLAIQEGGKWVAKESASGLIAPTPPKATMVTISASTAPDEAIKHDGYGAASATLKISNHSK